MCQDVSAVEYNEPQLRSSAVILAHSASHETLTPSNEGERAPQPVNGRTQESGLMSHILKKTTQTSVGMSESWLCSERPGPGQEDGACERDSDHLFQSRSRG